MTNLQDLLINNPNSMNSTFPRQFRGYQNTNFIEALFKHGMNHGWEGVGIMFIIQLYLFLSLDNIRGAFKYMNDKIALHGRNKLEQYCGHIANGFHYMFGFGKTIFLDWIAAFPIWLSKKWRRVKPVTVPVNNKVKKTKPKPQKHVLKLDPNNSIDLMSICNYVLNNKKTLKLKPRSDRIASTKKTTSEIYTLPSHLLLGKVGDIKITLTQHIGLKMESESDHVLEKVKKFTFDRDSMSNTKPKKGRNFKALKETLTALWGDDSVYFDDPQFWFEKAEWSCDPESMTNNEFTDLWRVLYYLGDINIIRKFMLYLTGQESFRFDGRVFQKGSDDKVDDFNAAFENKATMESFLSEVPTYHEQFLKKLDDQGTRQHVDKMAKKFLSKHQSGKGDTNTRISINFSSKSFTEYQLSKFGRQWFSKQIHAYYDASQKKEGEKVQIYKLFINYDTHTVEAPNPKFLEWEKEQEEERKRKETGEYPATTNSTTSATTNSTKPSESQSKKDNTAKEADNQDKQANADAGGDNTGQPTQPKQPTETKETGDGGKVADQDGADKGKRRRKSKSKSKSKSQRKGRHDPESSSSEDWSSSSESESEEWGDAMGYYNLFDSGPEYGGVHDWYSGPSQKKKKKSRHGGRKGGSHKSYWGHTTYKPPPSKTIKVEKKIPSAQAKLIKSDRKPLEYLYLPDDKMQAIVQYLRNFRERRDLFEQYGFPYRGGMILSGVPGCGKSSTILATATYLQKNIYYLDLGQIKTNNELKLCVDYIRTNSSNGGVIIFEDIDCMTNIVHQRRDDHQSVEMTTKTNITTIADEGDCPLSLSYLLNVLDGTMAPEDVIFIMTTNHVEKLDKALIRPGRIDLDIELTKCTRVQLAKIYNDLYNKELSPKVLEKFPEKHWIIAKVILHLFHNSFDANVDQMELIKPFLDTEEDKLGKLGEWS